MPIVLVLLEKIWRSHRIEQGCFTCFIRRRFQELEWWSRSTDITSSSLYDPRLWKGEPNKYFLYPFEITNVLRVNFKIVISNIRHFALARAFPILLGHHRLELLFIWVILFLDHNLKLI